MMVFFVFVNYKDKIAAKLILISAIPERK